jgi:hypothetical protein
MLDGFPQGAGGLTALFMQLSNLTTLSSHGYKETFMKGTGQKITSMDNQMVLNHVQHNRGKEEP